MEIKAGEFKAKCLELMDRVAEGHEEIIITKRGKPVAKLVPIVAMPKPEIFGYMKGTFEILGDIVAPTGEKWEADE
ncbi:MAG: type II toxin-antitoxin system prevent-host-death family antitoxin [Fibrobacterota bacterium]|nr:type II toxin-antitoxin system prevent-host-death family antitoxin [Fibrobacterota bacterium]